MDSVTLTAFQEILSDLVESRKYMELLEGSFTFLYKKGEGVFINFILFVLYTVDKVSLQHATLDFAGNEKLFYDKLILIEQNLEVCATKLNYLESFKKAINLYSQQLNKA
jgi:hypothetical protein